MPVNCLIYKLMEIMRKLLIAGMLSLGLFPAVSHADIVVNLPAGNAIDSLHIFQAPIRKFAEAKTNSDRGITAAIVPVNGNIATVAIPSDEGGTRFVIVISDFKSVDLCAAPDETITIDVTSLNPFDYSISGSAVTDGMKEVETIFKPYVERYGRAIASANNSQAADNNRIEVANAYSDYVKAVKKYFDENITSVNSLYAAIRLEGEDYLDAFRRLPDIARKSIFYPLAKERYDRIMKDIELERQNK